MIRSVRTVSGPTALEASERMPEEPMATDDKPVVIKLEAGKYAWCACGRSSQHPLCDGSHSGTGLTPMVFELEDSKTVALCACKKTNGAPFCDGSHSS